MKKALLLIAILLGYSAIYAQFSLNGEIRPRTEFLHGYKAPANQNTMFSLATSQRTRLGFNYQKNLLQVGIQVQDVRFWGEEKQLIVNDGAHTTIHQAWAKIKLNDVIALKVGRQELVYDDSRILGNVGWAQQARSHDLALFQYEKKDAFKLHLGLAVNAVQTDPFYVNNYKSMQFLWFNKKINDNYTLSILALNNGVQDTLIHGNVGGDVTTYSQIIGQRSVYKSGKLTVGLNLYYQMGNSKNVYYDDNGIAQRGKISAYNIGLDLKYKLSDNLSIGGGFEMLSGQSQTDTSASYNETSHTFVPLYGTNHKFNGWMDYFYVGSAFSVGLNDIFLKLDYKKDKFFTGMAFHYFMANADVLDQKELANSGKYKAMPSGLGMELDTYLGYKLSKDVIFKAGVSGMFDTETMRALKGGDKGASNYWAWAMIVVKPTFFKSEK